MSIFFSALYPSVTCFSVIEPPPISVAKNILLAFSNYTEKKLDQHLVGHAIMNFNLTNSPTVSAMEELEALIQTTAVCSLSELEDKVKSHFDFSKEIKRGNEDIEHSWRF